MEESTPQYPIQGTNTFDDAAVPQPDPKKKFNVSSAARRVYKKFTTKEGIIGDYNYAHLFTPQLPFMKKKHVVQPFFPLYGSMPLILGAVLGLQHSLAMLAGIVTPPLIIGLAANLETATTQYLVSASLITCGILSMIQISRFHIPFTKYYIGTGLISVVGTSFATITIVSGAMPQMYAKGLCPVADDGKFLPCPDGYGAIIGTSALCGLLEVALSFMPAKFLRKIFPPIVTGPVVLLIGIKLVATGFQKWAGGSGACKSRPETGLFSMCPNINAPHPLPWGSAEFIGLGFSVYVTIILCEKWGAPIMKSCAVVVGLLVGCIIAGAVGYFDKSTIDSAPVVTFVWVHTFKLSIYGPAVLPMLAVYIVLMMEAIGDITATCDVSRLPVEGPEYESRIQGGILADGLNGILAGLMTLTPMSTFAQNNGVISLTKCANRMVGYWCCFFLIIMGVFSKFAAALVAIPEAVLGGMTTFLFTSVAVSGLRIISTTPFTRRDRFVLTTSLVFGFGATMVPTWFAFFFTYNGDNNGLKGFLEAIELVMETGFAIAGFVGLLMNLFIPQEFDEGDILEEEVEGVSSGLSIENGATLPNKA
jgi:NCS2 family nucleobase:cation symporter-2